MSNKAMEIKHKLDAVSMLMWELSKTGNTEVVDDLKTLYNEFEKLECECLSLSYTVRHK